MTLAVAIRPEESGDAPAIHDLVRRAFEPMPFSGGDEQDLVDALRAQGDLVLSLVAVLQGGTVVGHAGFSPITIDGAACDWFQLAPVAAAPGLQRQGIGSALIRAGITMLADRGAAGIGVVGNPTYYERFGFHVVPGLAPISAHDVPYFRALVLRRPAPTGTVRYAHAFG